MAKLVATVAGGSWTVSTTWEEEGKPEVHKVPTAADDCKIVGGTSGEVKVEASAVCRSLETTGAAHLSVQKPLTLGTNSSNGGKILKLSTETVLTTGGTGRFGFSQAGTTVEEITSGGHDLRVVWFAAGATNKYKLLDKLTASVEVVLKSGLLNTNSQEISTAKWVVEGTTAKELAAGSSVIKCSASGVGGWESSGSELNFTFKPETSTVELTGTEAFVSCAPNEATTFNTLTFTGERAELKGTVTAATLNLNLTGATRVATFEEGQKFTVTTTLTKSAGAQKWSSFKAGEKWKLSKASGTVSLQELKLRDSVAEGGAEWRDVGGEDLGGNTGWTFESVSSGNPVMMMV